MKCQQRTTVLASVWPVYCSGFEFPSHYFHLCHDIPVGIHLLLINFLVQRLFWAWVQISKSNCKLYLGLIFTCSLLHVGVKMDRNCLSLFSVIYLTPLIFYYTRIFFSPPFPLNFKWLLPYPQHWLRKYIWKEKELIVQFFAFLLVDAYCLLFVWAFSMLIAWGEINDIFCFFIWNPFFYFLPLKKTFLISTNMSYSSKWITRLYTTCFPGCFLLYQPIFPYLQEGSQDKEIFIILHCIISVETKDHTVS